jgi:ADP-heptose:LPS heptosyltransferase
LHFVDEAFEAARFFDPALRPESFAGPPALGTREVAFAKAVRRELRGYRCFVVHCETGGPKMWPIARFRQVLEALLSLLTDFIVLVVGVRHYRLDDIPHGERVVPCDGLPLAKSMALVGCADGFIGVDSSMLHVADFFRVPSVGLFGPTDARRWGCRFTAYEHVCAPRGRLSALGADRVVAAVTALLGDSGRRDERVFCPSLDTKD